MPSSSNMRLTSTIVVILWLNQSINSFVSITSSTANMFTLSTLTSTQPPIPLTKEFNWREHLYNTSNHTVIFRFLSLFIRNQIRTFLNAEWIYHLSVIYQQNFIPPVLYRRASLICWFYKSTLKQLYPATQHLPQLSLGTSCCHTHQSKPEKRTQYLIWGLMIWCCLSSAFFWFYSCLL